MELIYIWVEKYKNIYNQGFTFSTRYNCEFFIETVKDKKIRLEIKEQENSINNFFGQNINITAIVGKNGSGKTTLLDILEDTIEVRDINRFIIYKKENKYFCEFKNIKPEIVFNKEIEYIDKKNFTGENFFNSYVVRIAHEKKIGKDELSHFYFGVYSGFYGGMNINRYNNYNMQETRFFVPRYINIATDQSELLNKLENLYKFDNLRLVLRNNSTLHLGQWIDKEINTLISKWSLGSKKVCVYEKTDDVLNHLQNKMPYPLNEIEIHTYDEYRKKIVTALKNIETLHRIQTNGGDRREHNKYYEFDLAVLISFVEYYLKNTEPCENSEVIYNALVDIQEEIKNNVLEDEYHFRIIKSYILNFFHKLQEINFKFEKKNLLSIEAIISSIEYIQQFKINYFDQDGNPYVDISIDNTLKENLSHLKILQKIFLEHEFDCGNEHYLRVFEYNLVNAELGSSYETISDGEKHYIRFCIDIIYYLQALKQYNFTPNRESITLFLADEPDNSMHPVWKQKLIYSTLEIFNTFYETPNINNHFIFTTHSPFLLSDIPKEHIVFLDKDEHNQCKVLDNTEVIRKKQTFGANIHTLLSDSFFMDDGLMGKFAQNKIQTIIDILNSVDAIQDKEDVWNIIEMIGEPFLKQKLAEKYHEKYLTEEEIRISKIKKLEDELKRLKNVEP